MDAPANDTLTTIVKYLHVILLGGLILYLGEILFVPMFMGLLIAMVMYPLCKKMELRRIPKSIAITICLSVVVILFAGLLALLVWQVNIFRNDLPELRAKLTSMLPEAQIWIAQNWGVSLAAQTVWIDKMLARFSDNSGNMLLSSFNATVSTLFTLFIIPVYAALFLYHRRTFVLFLQKIAGEKYRIQLDTILKQTTHTYFNYIKGMALVYIIVGVLNSIGLLLLGVEHAILFGMLTAIMTIIPYVGIIISALLPITVVFLDTGSIWYPLAVVGVFSFVQYLEANIIFPQVVGIQLNVSTWATLVAIMVGGILWGVSGMILFIPFVAIFKIITDHLEEGQTINILLSRRD